MHPFKRHTARDMEQRLHFCEWIIEHVLFKNVFFVLLLQQQSVVASYQI